MMKLKKFGLALALVGSFLTSGNLYAEPIKIGVILPITGPSASTGREVEAGIKLYVQQNGSTVAGRPVEVIVRDDGGVADTTRRLAQEMITKDKVDVISGFGLTPLAMSSTALATQSKTPMVVMAAATSSITDSSPYVVRSGFTLPQVTLAIAEWAPKNNIKRLVTIVTDYGPGIDAEKTFVEVFSKNGGQVMETLRVPLKNPDFSPFLQKLNDLKPDAVFVFVPSGFGGIFMKQFQERGLDKSGIRLIGTGDLTDDDLLNAMGDVALGAVTSHHYSVAHPSEMNKKFVTEFKAANNGMRPNFMALGGYDGMHIIYSALKATNGAKGETLLNAMKGLKFESPRGEIMVDPATRELVQDVYIRKVERVPSMNNELYNVEFDVVRAVKDPAKK